MEKLVYRNVMPAFTVYIYEKGGVVMKVMTIFGTRPEGIKMAPVIRLLQNHSEINCIIVNTGQHKEMLDEVLDLFSIQPQYNLNLMQKGQLLEDLSSKMISQLSHIMKDEKPDVVLVHGDTTTTFCGAYVSYLHGIYVAHVEAGLRTNDKHSPFPEEMNRQLVGRLADFHFAGTEGNKSNLIMENVDPTRIAVVGNTVIDALHMVISQPFTSPDYLQDLFCIKDRILIVTTHRRENLELLQNIYLALNLIVENVEDLHIIFPVHRNPKVREQVGKYLKKSERIHITEPLEYDSFCHLMNKSYLILTDSGGIQEEACALGVPVLLTRDNTERPEGVGNSIKIVGTSTESIYQAAVELLTNEAEHSRMKEAKNPFGDGKSSVRIVQFLMEQLMK